MGMQGAYQPKPAVSGPGSLPRRLRRLRRAEHDVAPPCVYVMPRQFDCGRLRALRR
jgi:hypothetical protein